MPDNPVTFEFALPEDRVPDFERLRADLGLMTHQEVVMNALALLHWSVRELKSGRAIASVDEGNLRFKEFWMPSLEHVRREAVAIRESPPGG